MARIQDVDLPYLEFAEAAAPGTPASGIVRIYAKTDGELYQKDDAGTETGLAGGGVGGGLVLLEQHTASSSATLDFTTFISGTYDTYKVIGTDLAPATDGAALWCRIGTGGGPTYDTGANYEWGVTKQNLGTSTLTAVGGTGDGKAVLADAIDNNAGYGFACFEILLHNLQSTAHRKVAHGTVTFTNNVPSLMGGTVGFHWVTDATAVTALRFLMSSGNIASGTIRIYGLEK